MEGTFGWRNVELERDMLSSGGRGCASHTEESKATLLLSDVSEEMHNHVIWWLNGLCFSLLGVHLGGLGGRRTSGRVVSVYVQSWVYYDSTC